MPLIMTTFKHWVSVPIEPTKICSWIFFIHGPNLKGQSICEIGDLKMYSSADSYFNFIFYKQCQMSGMDLTGSMVPFKTK